MGSGSHTAGEGEEGSTARMSGKVRWGDIVPILDLLCIHCTFVVTIIVVHVVHMCCTGLRCRS